jgi:sugar phosphate isomerase/epimerase
MRFAKVSDPGEDKVEWVRRVIALFSQGDGVGTVNGAMVDEPVCRRAAQIVRRAEKLNSSRAPMNRRIQLLAGFWTLAGDCYALGPSEVSTFSPRDRVEAAATVGDTGMGLVHQNLVFNAKAIGYSAMKLPFGDHGIAHIEVAFLGDWFERGEKKIASDRIRKDLIEAAHELRARDIKCAGEMWTDECDVAKMGDAFADVCDGAQQIGATIAMEILPMSNVRTLETATEIVNRAGQPNGNLCLDIWHVRGRHRFREDKTPSCEHGQFGGAGRCRCGTGGLAVGDTLFHRLYPGEGTFDCRAFIDAIEQAGFRSFYGVEVINEAYRKLPLREQAERSSEARWPNFQNTSE